MAVVIVAMAGIVLWQVVGRLRMIWTLLPAFILGLALSENPAITTVLHAVAKS